MQDKLLEELALFCEEMANNKPLVCPVCLSVKGIEVSHDKKEVELRNKYFLARAKIFHSMKQKDNIKE